MAPGQVLAAASLDSQLGFTWESPSPAQGATISDCLTAQAGWPRENSDGGWPWPATPRKPQGQRTQWTATDHVRAPPPCPCTADPPWSVAVGGHWSQPVLAVDWPG